jgi:hypothetical protein
VFLLGERSGVPQLAWALQQAGDGFLVIQGKLPVDALIPQRSLTLDKRHAALVRTGEGVAPADEVVQADAEVPADAEQASDGPAYRAALALLGDPARSLRKGRPAAGHRPPPEGVWRLDKTYADKEYPEAEYRLLALFRFWNVIHYFYPYKHLMDRDWNEVLPQFIPTFLTAPDARGYALAVAELSTFVPDGHTRVFGSRELTRFFGEVTPPLSLRLIEGAPVVTRVLDPKARIKVGDVVVAVDGERAEKRIERLGKYLAASTPAAHKAVVLGYLLGGPRGSACRLAVRGADGRTREVELRRDPAAFVQPAPGEKESFKRLPGNLGYADLTRLRRDEVEPMFDKLKDTKGIVFDLRGYPQGTFYLLAPRLNVKNAKYAAVFQRPLVSGDGGLEGTFLFRQPILATDKPKYQGKTVTLIDERAISQAEHTGLFLEAACGTTFIGTHTQGANGDVTRFVLPGNLIVMFGGHDVRHADGRQLQRIGLVPHIEVRPTIRGIREGADEVLERALQLLREGK